MDTNELKNIWKSQTSSNIRNYSPSELENIVVNAARKSMKAFRPNIPFRIVVYLVVLFVIWKIVAGHNSTGTNLVYFAALLILIVSYILGARSVYKLNQFKPETPVKEWMKYRLDEIEKSVKINSKYDFFIFGGSFLLGYVFFLMFQILANASFNWISVLVFIGLFFYVLIVRHFYLKKINRILEEIRALYKQLDEGENSSDPI